MKPRFYALLPALVMASACLEGTTEPQTAPVPEILLEVSGGLAGVDYALEVDGLRREVVGDRCVSGCDFQDGQVLRGLSEEQVAYLATLFRNAGIHQFDGTDFGSECCDQFHYALTYQDRDGASTIQGTSEAIPSALREAISTVAAFAGGVAPVIVALDRNPDVWPRDAMALHAWEVSGDSAQFRVVYFGGCRVHRFDMVAFGGWKESDPVQVSAILSHDGNGDDCEALIRQDLVFDLRPLKAAYQDAYGVSEPGSTTVRIGLEDAVSFSSMSPLWLEYTF